MTAKRKRIRGYTRSDGVRVKGYLRARPSAAVESKRRAKVEAYLRDGDTADIRIERPVSHKDSPITTPRKPREPTNRTRIKTVEIAVFRGKNDSAFASETALEAAKREIKRILKGRGKPRNHDNEWYSVWRDSVDVKKGTTVGQLGKLLTRAKDVPLEGGRVHLGINMLYGGRLIYVPISHAYDSMAEAGINAGNNILKMILQYLPTVEEANDDDDDND